MIGKNIRVDILLVFVSNQIKIEETEDKLHQAVQNIQAPSHMSKINKSLYQK